MFRQVNLLFRQVEGEELDRDVKEEIRWIRYWRQTIRQQYDKVRAFQQGQVELALTVDDTTSGNNAISSYATKLNQGDPHSTEYHEHEPEIYLVVL